MGVVVEDEASLASVNVDALALGLEIIEGPDDRSIAPFVLTLLIVLLLAPLFGGFADFPGVEKADVNPRNPGVVCEDLFTG